VQITLVQLAAQAGITCEAFKVGVYRIFVPTNMLFSVGGYENAGEVAPCPEDNFNTPLWDNDPPWQQKIFGVVRAGTQDEFVSEAEHRPTRLGLIDDVTRHTSTFELPVRVDKE
jgi:hypothetical protein